jgi:hypothetical protein
VDKLGLLKTIGIVFAFVVATWIASPGQTFTTLAVFDGTNGQLPNLRSESVTFFQTIVPI